MPLPAAIPAIASFGLRKTLTKVATAGLVGIFGDSLLEDTMKHDFNPIPSGAGIEDENETIIDTSLAQVSTSIKQQAARSQRTTVSDIDNQARIYLLNNTSALRHADRARQMNMFFSDKVADIAETFIKTLIDQDEDTKQSTHDLTGTTDVASYNKYQATGDPMSLIKDYSLVLRGAGYLAQGGENIQEDVKQFLFEEPTIREYIDSFPSARSIYKSIPRGMNNFVEDFFTIDEEIEKGIRNVNEYIDEEVELVKNLPGDIIEGISAGGRYVLDAPENIVKGIGDTFLDQFDILARQGEWFRQRRRY